MKSLLIEYVNSLLESYDDFEGNWNYFHLSEKDLGDEFEFTPRLPRSPYTDMQGNVIEDMSTPRISWAISIQDAIFALNDLSVSDAYVYAVYDIPEMHDCEEHIRSRKAPSSPDNEYGPGFSWEKYKNYVEGTLKKKVTEKFKTKKLQGCVPDALDTHEIWSLSSITGNKIGFIKHGKFIPSESK